MSLSSHTRLLLAVCAFSCGEKTAPTKSGPTVDIQLDDAVRTVMIDHAMPLSSQVSAPVAQWTFVRADARDGRWLEIPTPAATYPDGELRLSADGDLVTLGVFAGDRPLAGLGGITRIAISTRTESAPSLELSIVEGGAARAWKGTSREVPLADAIETQAVHAVRIIGDTEITLDSIANATIKMNQRGEHVVRVWDVPSGGTPPTPIGREKPTREVRRVTKILVE